MKKIACVCATAALAFSIASCNRMPADSRDADAQSLRAVETQWNQDFAAKDADKITAHYADDAVLISPGMPATTGRENIHKVLKELVSDPALSLKFQAAKVEIARTGDLGFTQGSYTMTMTDPGSKQIISDRGSYVTTYRKQQDGSWKAVADIASSETPPAAPANAGAKK